jgi:hypothetical protein
MHLLASIGPDVDVIIFFAAGMGVGASLLAALQSALQGDEGPAALARRVARIEMRLAAGKDAARLSRVMVRIVDRLPAIAGANSTTVFAAARPRHRHTAAPDGDALAKEFADAMQENMNAAVEIAKAIIDPAMNLNEPEDRREVAARIRKAATTLTMDFWEKHGGMILASPMSSALKDLLKTFFGCVKRLISAVTSLPREPGFAELDALLDCVIDVLDAAKAIIDEFERLSADA